MGYIRHNAIIATGWQENAIQALCDFAESIGAEAIRGEEMTNGYRTVVITPDGSKEGWETSAEGDAKWRLLSESGRSTWMRYPCGVVIRRCMPLSRRQPAKRDDGRT